MVIRFLNTEDESRYTKVRTVTLTVVVRQVE